MHVARFLSYLTQLASILVQLCGANESVSIKVMLFLSYKKHIIHEYRIKPAFDIAMEKVKRKVDSGDYLNFTISYIYSDQGCTGPKVLGPGIASTIFSTNNISAIFGPPCTSSGISVSDMAAYWNIPMLSGATTGSELGNKKRHTHLVRTSPGLDGMAKFFGRVVKLFGWKRMSNIADFTTLNHYFGLVGNAIQNHLLSEGYIVNKFSLTEFDSISDALIEATRRSRSEYFMIYFTLYDVNVLIVNIFQLFYLPTLSLHRAYHKLSCKAFNIS